MSTFIYGYDKAGNRTSVNEGSGNSVAWIYDKTYRLTRETRSGANAYATTFTYDAVGNRKVRENNGALTTYTYDAANQLTISEDNSGVTSYTFDAAGNQTVQQSPSNQRTTNTWNDDNRLVKVQIPDGTVTTATYRADGLRYQKQDSSGTRKFVYDGQNYLVETDQTGAVTVVYTNKPEQYGELISQRRET
jgi:YD repeat-containing protein